jgi:hypothetical protein
MGIGVSIVLIALGAILTFAVNTTVQGVDLNVIGWILMGAGVIGLIWSLIAMAAASRRSDTVIERRRTID